MKIDIAPEIQFKTARSGGKGGQNVNKVETMVEARWPVDASTLVSEAQKTLLHHLLANKITDDGFLLMKSQTERTQLGNKNIVIKKLNALINKTLQPKKIRILTKIPTIVKEKRLQNKQLQSSLKETRKKYSQNDY